MHWYNWININKLKLSWSRLIKMQVRILTYRETLTAGVCSQKKLVAIFIWVGGTWDLLNEMSHRKATCLLHTLFVSTNICIIICENFYSMYIYDQNDFAFIDVCTLCVYKFVFVCMYVCVWNDAIAKCRRHSDILHFCHMYISFWIS